MKKVSWISRIFLIICFLSFVYLIFSIGFNLTDIDNQYKAILIIIFFLCLISFLVWFFWSYQKLSQEKALKFIDRLFFVATSFLKFLVFLIPVKLAKHLLPFLMEGTHAEIGFMLFLLFSTYFMILWFMEGHSGYQTRLSFWGLLGLGLYASLFLALEDLGMPYFSDYPLLANIVLCCSVLIGLILFGFDTYEANLNKETLWWKAQYHRIGVYKDIFKKDIARLQQFWSIFWGVHNQQFKFKSIWDWIKFFFDFVVFCFLSCYTLILFIYPFSFIGQFYFVSMILNLIKGNWVPILVFYLPVIFFTLLCKNKSYKNYLDKTYGEKYLSIIYWNTYKTVIDYGLKRGFQVAIISVGVAKLYTDYYNAQLERNLEVQRAHRAVTRALWEQNNPNEIYTELPPLPEIQPIDMLRGSEIFAEVVVNMAPNAMEIALELLRRRFSSFHTSLRIGGSNPEPSNDGGSVAPASSPAPSNNEDNDEGSVAPATLPAPSNDEGNGSVPPAASFDDAGDSDYESYFFSINVFFASFLRGVVEAFTPISPEELREAYRERSENARDYDDDDVETINTNVSPSVNDVETINTDASPSVNNDETISGSRSRSDASEDEGAEEKKENM